MLCYAARVRVVKAYCNKKKVPLLKTLTNLSIDYFFVNQQLKLSSSFLVSLTCTVGTIGSRTYRSIIIIWGSLSIGSVAINSFSRSEQFAWQAANWQQATIHKESADGNIKNIAFVQPLLR